MSLIPVFLNRRSYLSGISARFNSLQGCKHFSGSSSGFCLIFHCYIVGYHNNIIIISLLNPLVVYNTKLQGRSRIRRTHNYTWRRRQKQLNPIVTVGNKITKAVRSDKAEFRTGKTRPQPVPMSDIRGLRQQV